MKRTLIAAMFMIATTLSAQTEIRLWGKGAPNSNGIATPQIDDPTGRIGNVSDPSMFVYNPESDKNIGAALLICPGGGYSRLAMEHEGHQIAKWLAENGITGIVLKYRMPNGHHEVPLSDAQQAMKLIRSNASKWGIDTTRVGVAGSSAGGHLASTLSTKYDKGSRPDFSILFYPVISMDEKITHRGSRENLIGKNASEELVKAYSGELNITSDTPPTLLLHSDNDTAVPAQNSTHYYSALKDNGVKATMYIFPVGGHGWGFKETFEYHSQWKELMLMWLKEIKIIK